MRKLKIMVLALVASAIPVHVHAQPADLKLNYLTGLPKLACEAILCLSSGTTPSECKPSLNHYFDIRVYKKGVLDWSATLDARRAFLNVCPASKDPGMPDLIKVISEGGGRCDAATLNRSLQQTAKKVRRVQSGGDNGDIVYYEEFQAVKDSLPAYCGAYANHSWTYEIGVKYVGTPCTGGKWVDAKDYEKELAKWQANNPSVSSRPQSQGWKVTQPSDTCEWVTDSYGNGN